MYLPWGSPPRKYSRLAYAKNLSSTQLKVEKRGEAMLKIIIILSLILAILVKMIDLIEIII